MSEADKLKVVYVLVSNETDFFYEQLTISILSLRYRTPNVYIHLLTEKYTYATLKGNRKKVLSMIDEISVKQLSNKYSMTEKSRILKTLMRDIIHGDFLYIDCDTIICDDLQNITDLKKTSAVLDNHQLVNKSIYEFQGIFKNAKKVGYSVGYQNRHYNSGVIWCKDDIETHDFFRIWNQLWHEGKKHEIIVDQLSFNESNYRKKGFLQELDGTWNCQLRYGIPYLSEAKIIHYFASNLNKKKRNFGFLLADYTYFEKIKHGKMPDEVKKIISSPKSAFNFSVIVETESDDYKLIYSNIGKILKYFERKHTNLFLKIDYAFGSLISKWKK